MGIENRNGKLYYYEKRRVGGRVVSEYRGKGMIALLSQRYAQEEAEKKAAERERMKRKKEEFAALDAELDCIFEWVNILTNSELLISGFHHHKGQWRKRRNGINNKAGDKQTRKTP